MTNIIESEFGNLDPNLEKARLEVARLHDQLIAAEERAKAKWEGRFNKNKVKMVKN